MPCFLCTLGVNSGMREARPELDEILEPAIFWFWNGALDRDGIRRRLDAFREKGLRAVYIHPMPDSFRPGDFHGGMTVPYLSDTFFEWIRFAAEEIRKREMILWLYDEGGWPSGRAGGGVVNEKPAYGTWSLHKAGNEIQPRQYLEEIDYPDLMNRDATECFIRLTHERYRACLGHAFGRSVRGMFTDEPRIIGRLGTDTIPWSPCLPAAFEEDHGVAFHTVRHDLFEPFSVRAGAARTWQQYLQTVSRLIAMNYFQPLRDWCDEHGLIFEGHHTGENEFSRHGEYFGDFLQQARAYRIPGVDAIWRQIFPGQSGGNYVRLASSVARLRGEGVALSESFAVYGPGLTLQDMHWVIAFQVVRGVNKIGWMASHQDTSRGRRIGLCTDLAPGNPVWRDIDLLVEFQRRAARFSARGRVHPRVGVFCRTELTAMNHAERFDAMHEALCDTLQDQGVEPQFLGIGDLREAIWKEGALHAGPFRLTRLAVHCDLPLTKDESGVLSRLIGEGLPVDWLGNRAEWTRFGATLGNGGPPDWFCYRESPAQIECPEDACLDLSAPVPGLRVMAAESGDERTYLFFNQNDHEVDVVFRLDGEIDGCVVGEWPLEDGAATALDPPARTAGGWRLYLHPGQARALTAVRGHAEGTTERAVPRCEPIEADWTVQVEEIYTIEDGIRKPERTAAPVAVEPGDYSRIDPAFSGSLRYRAVFDWPATQGERLFLDLGDVFYSAEVVVNGRSCGRRAWRPYRFEITQAVHAARQSVEVRVTNTPANQWARPDVKARDKEQWGNMYLDRIHRFLDDRCHAGLAGPVRLYALALDSSAPTWKPAGNRSAT